MISRPWYKSCRPNPHHEISHTLVSTLPMRQQKVSKVRQRAEIETQISLTVKPGSILSLTSHPILPTDMMEPLLFSSLVWGGVRESLFSSLQLILEQEKRSCPLPMVRLEIAGEKHKLCNVNSCFSRCVQN